MADRTYRQYDTQYAMSNTVEWCQQAHSGSQNISPADTRNKNMECKFRSIVLYNVK